jgi:uncharacterized protein with ParB-like and HNH nuclease domain
MRPPELTTRKIQRLRRELQARQFAIPKLQRNFVWDARRAAKLLDSIYHNMPIGSLFLWEMDRRSAHLIRQSAEVLPSFNPANPRIWFVIDGQQRLSVLFQAFEGQVRENDAGRSIDFDAGFASSSIRISDKKIPEELYIGSHYITSLCRSVTSWLQIGDRECPPKPNGF